MFKSRKKRQQEKLLLQQQQQQEEEEEEASSTKLQLVTDAAVNEFQLLDDIHLAHDFRSSIILPELNKDLDPNKLSRQQQHLAHLRDIPESPTPTEMTFSSPPQSPPPDMDGTKQIQELAAWRHQRSQTRYSNGLFGGKQRGRPNPNQIKKSLENDDEMSTTDNTKEFSDDNNQDTILEEMYEPDSDTEENFFFKDFSSIDNKKKTNNGTRRRRTSQKVSTNGRFDLSSFAKDLHENRLSVIQPRQSKIIMTEHDELELEKLLERQRQRMSTMTVISETIDITPPMPCLDLIKPHQTPSRSRSISSSSNSSNTTSSNTNNSYSDDSIEKKDVSQEFIVVLKPVTSVSSSSTFSTPDQLKRSVSTTVKSRLTPVQHVETRKSLSMEDIHIQLNEPSVTLAALDWTNQDPTSFSYKKANTPIIQQPQPSKSRSLFGSLRNKTQHSSNGGGGVTSIKGLVRNFSSSHKSNLSNVDRTSSHSGELSRAAMAVIQHDVAKHEQKKDQKQQPRSTKSDSSRIISHLIARASSHTRKHNATKIVNMKEQEKKRAQVVRRTIIYVQPDSLHDLLKNGGGSSKKLPPKINTSTRNTIVSDGSLSPDDNETIRSREYVTATKVIRQTSVKKRVVEDSLSRQGSTNNKRWQLKSVDENSLTDSSSHGSGDYLEGVELREMSDGSVVWGIVKKQGNRKSFFAAGAGQEEEEEEEEEEKEEEEQEEKEEEEQEEQEEEEATIKRPTRHLPPIPPPPIPRRSPRRHVSPPPTQAQEAKTDIYYSNQVTLPNLLKMMQQQQQQQHPGDDDDDFDERAMSSVDDQLDEMMRILTQH